MQENTSEVNESVSLVEHFIRKATVEKLTLKDFIRELEQEEKA